MNTNIIDHGHDDPIPFELTDTDRAIADQTAHAIAQQRYYLNTRDKVHEQAKARAAYERGERDFLTHNKDEAPHAD
jgi:hypothetical protein